MFDKAGEIFRQRDLRRKILITLGLLAVFRAGAFLPLPFINSDAFGSWFAQLGGRTKGIVGMIGMITAGSLSRATIFSLGIMPYISSSIIIQMLTKIIPQLQAMAEEGGAGRRKLNQYTRYLTVLICTIQSTVACIYISSPDNMIGGDLLYEGGRISFIFMGVLTITTGTIVLMWIGEQISEYGIGNGISLIIMVGIISRIPPGLKSAIENFSFAPESGSEFGVGVGIILIALFLAILFGVVYIYLGKRKIPVQYGRRMRGNRQMSAQKQAIWFRVNQAGVIPVIFASALMTFPNMISKALNLAAFDYSSFEFNVFFVLLIIFFSYFYTSMMFNPEEIADQLKENGAFIPGYRAGQKTKEYLNETMIHLTFVGALFLATVAILPKLLGRYIKIPFLMSTALFGGVGLLIVIGVSLDLMQKVQEHFYMREYGGFLKKKLRGRRR